MTYGCAFGLGQKMSFGFSAIYLLNSREAQKLTVTDLQ
jgi:hypothetical protein